MASSALLGAMADPLARPPALSSPLSNRCSQSVLSLPPCLNFVEAIPSIGNFQGEDTNLAAHLPTGRGTRDSLKEVDVIQGLWRSPKAEELFKPPKTKQVICTNDKLATSENSFTDHCPPVRLNGELDHSQMGAKTPFHKIVSSLRQCRALAEGERVHACIIECGYEDNTFIGNLLIQMYGKFGSLEKAREVFDGLLSSNVHSWTIMIAAYAQNGNLDEAKTLFARMPQQDIVSWSGMITACAQNGRANEALEIFGQMQSEGFKPSKVTYICALSACASLAALTEGWGIHGSLVGEGYESDAVIGAALVHMYGRCGSLDNARAVFSKLSDRDVVSWSSMIVACVQNGHRMEALNLFQQMCSQYVEPNQVTYICILGACDCQKDLVQGQKIHVSIVNSGFESEVAVGAALVNMYGRCGSKYDAEALFGKMSQDTVLSWNAMIAACGQMGDCKQALNFFHEMQIEGLKPDKNTYISVLGAYASLSVLSEGQVIYARIVHDGCDCDVFVGNALINMFGKCGSTVNAKHVFNKLPRRNLVSWSAMIAACSQSEHSREALELFQQMQSHGFRPDKVSFISILGACVNLAALKEGKEIHAIIVNYGYDLDSIIGTSLITMYGKCGNLDDAKAVFDNLPQKDVISWSAIITVCAQNGHGKKALEFFRHMLSQGVQPNRITFLSVLTACSHTGLVEDGKEIFASMTRDYGVMPSLEHYMCMVDILGRAGQIAEAEDFIRKLPNEGAASAWLNVLAVCKIHGDGERGVHAADLALKLDSNNAGAYVSLSNLYAALSKWDNAAKVISVMDDNGVERELAHNCVDVMKLVHEFIYEHLSHCQRQELCARLDRSPSRQMEAPYLPETHAITL